MAPGNHCNWTNDVNANANNPFNITVEQHRCFDYWLKGVKNGVMEQPPITIYTYNRPAGQEWASAWQWPLPATKDVRYYLRGSATGFAAGGVNSGGLDTPAPQHLGAKDVYTTDYEVTSANRNDKGLVYTTAPMTADTPLIGVRLVLAASVDDRHRAGNPFTPVVEPAPVLNLLRDHAHPSFLSLPVTGALQPDHGRRRHRTADLASDTRPSLLAELAATAISAGGTAALRTRVDGHTVAVEFPAGALKRGAVLTGRFGGTYDYGDMRFTATVA